MAGAQEQPKEPRPTRTRYPIPNEDVEALKAAARNAKLPRHTANQVKDPGKKAELAALGMAPAALEPGLEPVAAPTGTTNFEGITATGWIPPDCTMAAGPQHVLLSVNSSLAIYNKTGGAPVLQRTLNQWFANVVQGLTIFDPKVLFDQHAGRWVVVAFAYKTSTKRTVHLLSVSTTGNPLGQWRNYVFDASLDGSKQTKNWADYPGLGVDSQAVYITSNMFTWGDNGTFQYAKVRVIPKNGPYAGKAATYFDFVRLKNADNSLAFTVTPSHTFGAPQAEYLVNTGFPSAAYLTVWRITNPTATTPTLTRRTVQISPYTLPPDADQKGGVPPLNTGDVRALYAVYRGDLWGCFTTAHSWGAGANRAAVQWFQIRAGDASLVQQGIYGASTAHYFYPSLCPDNNGNVTMVVSRSGPGEYGSILYTGRRANDPLGTFQPSALLKAGVAHYQALDGGGRNRWGDYNGISADPANARVVWFYSMYASATNTWGTWVGSAFF